MLAVSNAFNEAFKQDYRDVKMRVKIKDVTYTDSDIISFNYNAGSIVGESFAIGSTFANTMKLTLCKIVEGLKQLDEVIPEMGIVLPDGSTEFVKLGTFIISEQVNPDRNENRTSIECADRMIMLDDPYESKLNYPAKIRDVALEIANLAGVEVDKVSFGRLMDNTIRKPIGYTFRQALGLIAQFEAGYACFDRNGLLAIKTLEDKNYEVTPNEYFQKGLVKNELMFRPAGIQVKVNGESEEDKVLKIGNEKGSVIHLENKVMTDGLLKLVYDKVKNINYYPYTLKWRGNPAVEVGDWLQVTDTKGNLFKVPNLSYSFEYKGGLTATSTVETVASNEVRFGYKGILDQTVEYVGNALKDVGGNLIYYGVEAPPNPKEGDTWFKYVDSDTEIWVYEKVGEPDVFDWVFKISSAVDDSIKEKIDKLEQQSKDQQINIDKALSDAEKAREEAEIARQEAFDSSTIAKQAEKDALDALLKGDQNSTQITTLEGQQKLTNTKVEGNTANILNLQADSEKLSLSIGKVQADVDSINVGDRNLILKSKVIENSYLNSVDYQPQYGQNSMRTGKIAVKQGLEYLFQNYTIRSDFRIFYYNLNGEIKKTTLHNVSTVIKIDTSTFWVEVNFDVPGGKYTDNAKITEGNKSGGWSPAPEDLISKTEFATFEANYQGFQSDVKSDLTGLHSQQTQMAGQISGTVEKVDNLEVGGRNYFNNSTIISSLQNVSGIKRNNDNGFDFTGSQQSPRGLRVSNVIKSNGYWTVSGYARGSQNFSPGFQLEICDFGKKKIVVNSDNSWTYFELTVNVNNYSANVYNFVDFDNIDSWAYYFIKDFKVEKGNKATDWSPAPEDNASKTEVLQLHDQLTLTSNKVESIDGTVTKQQGQIAILSDNINLKVDKDNAIAQINLSPEKIRLDAKFIHLSGKTLIDDAVIKTAHIDNLAVTGAKIQDATISSAKIISIVADKIITGTLTGITLTGNTINGGTINNAYFYNTGARGTVRINNGGISALEFWTEDNGAFMSENGYAILRSGGKKSSDHVFLQASTEVRATRVRTFDEYIPIKASSFYAQSSSFQGYNNTTFSTEWGYVTLRSYNNAVYLQAKTEVKATKPSDPETYVPVRASSFPSGSLERFKTNIQEYKADALELIDNSTIYTYRLKSEVKDMIDKPRIGLVIGDGYKTPKEVIDGDGVEQYAMNSISWKAIQELHRKIKRLEERLEYENIT